MGITIGISSAARWLVGLLVLALPVRVTTTSGDPVEGELVAIGPEQIVLRVDAEEITLPAESLVRLASPSVEPAGRGAIGVRFRDGSQVAAESVSLSDERLRLQLRQQGELEVPVDRVASIRFRPPAPATDARWLGLAQEERRGDTLVIRRDEGRLDAVDGIVEGITQGRVAFDLGGNRVEAPVERLEGVLFGGGDGEPPEQPLVVADRFGSRWVSRSVTLASGGESLQLELAGNVRHEIRLDQVSEIQWSGGWLSLAEASPAERAYRSQLPTAVDAALLEGWFGPRVADNGDLVMVAGSEVVYRAEADYNTLTGSVMRDPDVAASGLVRVRVRLDDRVAWEQSLENGDRQGFEIDLDGASRIRFEVDAADDGEVGDRVRWIRPRLLK